MDDNKCNVIIYVCIYTWMIVTLDKGFLYDAALARPPRLRLALNVSGHVRESQGWGEGEGEG